MKSPAKVRKEYRHSAEWHDRIRARMTKGAAFMLDGPGYDDLQRRTRDEIQDDSNKLPLADFVKKYEVYIY